MYIKPDNTLVPIGTIAYMYLISSGDIIPENVLSVQNTGGNLTLFYAGIVLSVIMIALISAYGAARIVKARRLRKNK